MMSKEQVRLAEIYWKRPIVQLCLWFEQTNKLRGH
jgi:hypothetical protein